MPDNRVNIWDDSQCEYAGHVWVSAGGDLARWPTPEVVREHGISVFALLEVPDA